MESKDTPMTPEDLKAEFDTFVQIIQGKRKFSGGGLERLSDLVGSRYEDLLKQATRELELREQLRKRQELLKQLEKEPEWFNYFAAFLAAVVSTLVVHPIDTIKTRLITQQQQREEQGGAAASASADENSGRPLSLADLPDLYQGVVGNILKEGPSSALYLGVYEAVKVRLLQTSLGSTPLVVYLISGAAGEFFGSIVRAPAEAIKSNVQAGRDADTMESAQRVLGNEDGRRKVFAAWSASLWRDIPFGAVQLAIFESLKAFIVESPEMQLDVDSLAVEALLGAIGGAVGAFVSVPFDVVTTRIITQESPEGEEPLAFVGMAGKVLEEEGPTGFFTGWKERVLYWGPAVSIFLTSYCWFRQNAVVLF